MADGLSVIGVDDLSHGSLDNLDDALGNRLFSFELLDCTRADSLTRVFGECDQIVHLAGLKIPRYGDRFATLTQNVAGIDSVCSAALFLDADLIVASTSDVYGNAPSPLEETSSLVLGPPTSQRWAYATSKLYAEHLVLALHEERGLRGTILRLFGSYGPRNHPTWWGGPQAAFAEALLDDRDMEIHGDGNQARSFTYVSDTVEAIVRALRTSAVRGEVVNIGSREPVTIIELARRVQTALGVDGPLRARFLPYAALPGQYEDVRRRVPNTTKAEALLAFIVRVGLPDGLARTVEWHRSRRRTGVEVGR